MCSQFSGISEKKQCKNNKFFACYQFSALVEKAASEKSSSRLGNESVDSSGCEGFVRKFPCHCPFGTMECDFRLAGGLCGNTKIERRRGRFPDFQLCLHRGAAVPVSVPAASPSTFSFLQPATAKAAASSIKQALFIFVYVLFRIVPEHYLQKYKILVIQPASRLYQVVSCTRSNEPREELSSNSGRLLFPTVMSV